MPRKKKIETVKLDDDGVPLDATSSLNKYFMCVCGKKFDYRNGIIQHLQICKNDKKEKIVCRWCNLEFKNRGNLINHGYYMHGDKKLTQPKFKCDVCDAKFTEKWKIKFHIRRDHFNLWARIPLANAKQVNQVWFERVLNTNLVMQMKKPAANRLILKPAPPNTNLQVHENKRIDLRNQYPTKPGGKENTKCEFCNRMLRKCDLKKHIDEKHYNIRKHKCNNCKRSFKRSYIYLKHICHKRINRTYIRGVRHVKSSSIRIASVETLKTVSVE